LLRTCCQARNTSRTQKPLRQDLDLTGSNNRYNRFIVS
jgi:hypothetical protein